MIRRRFESARALLRRHPLLSHPIDTLRHLDAGARAGRSPLEHGPDDADHDEILARKTFLRRSFHALAFNGIDGDYAEFGCNTGSTFRMAHGAARLAGHQRHLWAFDSFAGLPSAADARDDHPAWVAGAMATSEADFHRLCTAAGIAPEEYTTVAGFYDVTLRDDAPGHRPDRIALAYVDCDLYSSTIDVLRFLVPRLRHGMILAFDDYYCYAADAAPGERTAAAEVFAALPQWRLVPYQQFGWHGMSFVLERTDLVPTDPLHR
jgi:hypothetical protein